MLKIDQSSDAMTVKQGTWLFTALGLFFAVLGLLLVVAGVLSLAGIGKGKPSPEPFVLGPIIGIVAYVFLRIPAFRTTSVARDKQVRFEERCLFGGKVQSSGPLVALSVDIGPRWARLVGTFADDPDVIILAAPKTWVTDKDSPELRRHGERIATFAGVPLR